MKTQGFYASRTMRHLKLLPVLLTGRFAKQGQLSIVLGLLLAVQFIPAVSSRQLKQSHPKPNRLAIILASPWESQEKDLAMLNDAAAMKDVLQKRSFSSTEVLVLKGHLSRQGVLTFIANAHKRIEGWTSGDVFLYYTGHGKYLTRSNNALDVGLYLNNALEKKEQFISWKELVNTLAPPSSVSLILLPDC